MKSRESLVRTFSAEMVKKWHQLCNHASQLFKTKTFGLREQETRPRMIKTENVDVILNTVVTICLKLYYFKFSTVKSIYVKESLCEKRF